MMRWSPGRASTRGHSSVIFSFSKRMYSSAPKGSFNDSSNMATETLMRWYIISRKNLTCFVLSSTHHLWFNCGKTWDLRFSRTSNITYFPRWKYVHKVPRWLVSLLYTRALFSSILNSQFNQHSPVSSNVPSISNIMCVIDIFAPVPLIWPFLRTWLVVGDLDLRL